MGGDVGEELYAAWEGIKATAHKLLCRRYGGKVLLGLTGSALAAPSVAKQTVGHLVSGAGNGNDHFGGGKPEAFVLSDATQGDKSMGADFTLMGKPADSRVRFVAKYVDDNNWAYVGYDAGSSWFIEWKNNGQSSYTSLSGLPSIGTGQTASVLVSHEGDRIDATVEGKKASGTSADFAAVMKKDGKVGIGAGTFNSQTTDLTFRNVRMGDTVVNDFSKWTLHREQAEGQKWTPAEEVTLGRKWIQITGGSHNGGGHEYGDASKSAPAALLNNTTKVTAGQPVELAIAPMTDDINFGVFYTYVDNDNWFYYGYDKSSGWYCQWEVNGSSSYASFEGVLPTPAKGEELKLSMNVSNENVSLTVGDRNTSKPLQQVGDFVKAQNGKGKMGVKVNQQSSLKFADVTIANKDVMEETWGWAAEREGQQMSVSYVNLASVSGTVKNEQSAPIAGATVRVGTKTAKTDDKGAYKLDKIEVGTKNVTVIVAGYEAAKSEVNIQNLGDKDNVVDFSLKKKAEIDLSKYKAIESSKMKVYVSDAFPQPVRYELKEGANKGKFFRGQETATKALLVNGQKVTPQVKCTLAGDTATYVLDIDPVEGMAVDANVTVELKVEGTTLSWKVTKVEKADNSAALESIDLSGMNLLSLDMVDGGQGFAGAKMSTNVALSGDSFYSFDGTFNPNSQQGFMYGILSNKDLSAGIFSNSEKEKDERITLNSGLDTMGLASSVWYYEHGDAEAQKYVASHDDVQLPTSELPWVKVAISEGDTNDDRVIDWNDGANAIRPSLNVPYGSEAIKDLVSYRIVMNFGSEVTNPYALTADNVKKVALITDGLPQALLLKGYGNEGHDSANSEYADISSKEGGTQGFRDLIEIAHQYNTEVGIHVNAQEAYAESKSFNERMIQGQGAGWGWMDQSIVIDKLWDLGSNARWNRFVQLYDRINGTSFANKNFEKGEYVGDPAVTGASAASLDELRKDAATRDNNMDFIYLDVWYEDAWETRRIAEQINALGWRFSTEFPNEGEYNSTWSHWATEVQYGGNTLKGINSDIVRFLRNDQRDISPNNAPSKGGVMDNPLLGGWSEEGFEGWGNENDFNAYINTTFTENLPTRFLQHYQVVDWDVYTGAEGDKSPVANHEKQIVLTNEAGDKVVVTRKAEQRDDSICERVITLNGAKVLEDGAYLLPWEQDGEKKLYHYNVDGGSTTWDLPAEFNGGVLYKLTDQGREKVQDVAGGTVTIDAEAKTPYIIVKADSSAKTADEMNFGEGTGVVDPGFNTYAEGEQLNAEAWSGDIEDASVTVKHAPTGDQRLTIADPAKDVAVTTQLSGLEPGKTYVAELYIANESDAKATVTVASGKNKAARSMTRSLSQNYTASDQRQSSSLGDSYMTRMYVKFTADAKTADLTISRAAGEGSTYVDNIRFVENDKFPVQDEQGNYTQDFENAVSGLYPFVIGPSSHGGDAVAHLSERNGEFTQTGWKNKEVDDAIDGNWSLKYHDGRKGLLYQTTPQNILFEPGKKYIVEFDYQAGSAATGYQMIVGDGDVADETSYTVPTEFLPVTFKDGVQTTAHIKMEVTGAESGQTWIGLYSAGNEGNTKVGSGDFVLDNFKVTSVDNGGDNGGDHGGDNGGDHGGDNQGGNGDNQGGNGNGQGGSGNGGNQGGSGNGQGGSGNGGDQGGSGNGQNGNGGNQGGSAQKPSKPQGGLPQTGDTALLPVVGVAIVGVALIAGGVYVARKRRS